MCGLPYTNITALSEFSVVCQGSVSAIVSECVTGIVSGVCLYVCINVRDNREQTKLKLVLQWGKV